MYHYSPISKPIPKEAKIVKLNKFPIQQNTQKLQQNLYSESEYTDISFVSFSQIDTSSPIKSTLINSSIGSEKSYNSLSSSNSDVSGEFLPKMLIIEDHTTQLVYGGISVKHGEIVYLINESQYYCLVENQNGLQGIVPKEICIDLEQTVRNAKQNFKANGKVTSL
ncbi:unnamed protein product [Brachionus calyciflorus]|uniref:SH3 domain-containing protein n=1 Tax=Brachionus calyciflorus TaxID=104777 RepID=A0A813Q115_9BILA|nr:unnamed protein product [Brachionus calyciflorus]